MTEHLTPESIERYRRRDVDEAQRRDTDSHLAKCDACLDKVLAGETSGLAFNALNEAFLPAANDAPFHLSAADLSHFASGDIAEADRVIYSSHLEICSQCNEEWRKLSETAKAPNSPPPVRVVRESIGSTSGTIGWPVWGWLTPVRAFAAIALVGIIVLALIQYRRQSSTSTEDARVSQDDAGTSRPVASPDGTEPGLKPAGPPSSILVQMKDNNRDIRLDQNGNLFGLEDLDDATQKTAKAALAGGGLAKPKVIDDLAPPPISLLGPSSRQDRPRLINPLGRVVAEARPTFRWRPRTGADAYVVSIYDESFNPVAKSPMVGGLQWTPPASLARGRNYSWEVTAFQNGKEMPTTSEAEAEPEAAAKFRILEAEKLNALTKLRQQKPVSHLALGLAYAQAGLRAEAEREFRQLVRENPESEAARKLLQTVQGWK